MNLDFEGDELPLYLDTFISTKRSYAKTYKWDVIQKSYPVSFKEVNEIQKRDEIQLVLEKEETVHLKVRSLCFSDLVVKKLFKPAKLIYCHGDRPKLSMEIDPNCILKLYCDEIFQESPMLGKGTLNDPFQIDQQKLNFSVEDVQKLKVGSFVHITEDKMHDRKESTIRITEIQTYKRTFPKGMQTPPPVSIFEFSWSNFTKPYDVIFLKEFKELDLRSEHGDHAFDVQLKYETEDLPELEDDSTWQEVD